MIDIPKSIAISAVIIIVLIFLAKPELIDEIKDRLNYGNYLSPKEVIEHPHKYVGEIITVKGYWGTYSIMNEGAILERRDDYTYALLAQVPYNITVVNGAKYLFTGKLIITNIAGVTVPKLLVTKVKPI